MLITGNIDLSIGSVIGMSTMTSATLMTRGVNPWVAVVITMAACLVVGVVNGTLVAKFNLPPFIATLGTMTVARGIAQIVNHNYNTDAIGDAAQGFRDLFYYGKTLGIYNPVWIAIIPVSYTHLDVYKRQVKLFYHNMYKGIYLNKKG